MMMDEVDLDVSQPRADLSELVAKVDKLQFKNLASEHQVKASYSEPMEVSAADSSSNESKGAEGGTPAMIKLDKASPINWERRVYDLIRVKSHEMTYKFQKLFLATKKSLRERKVSVSELVGHLQCVGGIEPIFTDIGLSPFRLELLADSETVNNVMSVVKDYCSFFSYHVLEHIIDEFGTSKDRENLATFKKDFEECAWCYVVEGSFEVGKMSEKGASNNSSFFVLLDDSFDSCSFSHISVFIADLRKALKISSDVDLRVHRIP